MSRTFLKLCSLVLSLVMVFQLLPLNALAAELNLGDSADVSANPSSSNSGDASIIAEITSRRSEYSKEYLLSNGSHLATVSGDALHYSKDGQWKEIDNTLTPTNLGRNADYTNTDGPWEVTLPGTLSNTSGVSIAKDGYTLSFFMTGELKSSGDVTVAAASSDAETFALNTGTALWQAIPTPDRKICWHPLTTATEIRYNTPTMIWDV